MDNDRFGQLVAARRKEKGLTQKQLAAALNVTDKAVSKWECGLGFPDIKLIEPLAAVLELSALELLRAERIEEKTITAKEANEAVQMALEKSQKKSKRVLMLAAAFVLLIAAVLCVAYVVSVSRGVGEYEVVYVSNAANAGGTIRFIINGESASWVRTILVHSAIAAACAVALGALAVFAAFRAGKKKARD